MTLVTLSCGRLLFGGAISFLLLWILSGEGKDNLFLSSFTNFVSWKGWHEVSKLSFAAYLWHVPLLGAVFITLQPFVIPYAKVIMDDPWTQLLFLVAMDILCLGVTHLVAWI